MHKMEGFSTIAAIATPPGKGGVAVIRISGAEAFRVADRIFSPKNQKPLSEQAARTQVYGDILLEGDPIDDGLATRFPAPHSYTGEDTVEISCHGGFLITKMVLSAALAAGASIAAPGEFTRRAFMNGKLSLTDAEAIGNLLEASSAAAVKLASAKSRDRLSAAMEEIQKDAVALMGSLFARIDYPDEDLGDFSDAESISLLRSLLSRLDALIATYRTGRAVNEGIATVICGKPNAGKSTLYNLLVGEDAAIVTEIEGTTRDVLERTVPLGQVLLRLSDTAGIRETSDVVERIGVEKTHRCMEEAELILAVFDTSRPLTEEDEALLRELETLSGTTVAILNKSDLPAVFDPEVIQSRVTHSLTLSAKQSDATPLCALIEQLFTDGRLTVGEDAIVSSARQHAGLLKAKEHFSLALEAYLAGLPTDAAASDIERAIGALGELCGRSVSEAIVSDIFSRFCVGK
ncbi:MAG: tRNA uridine-5-carboxymethylaminomethyl(34) synthesis GTPase MnmE [Clostridia bacterium]|nr:tRNA uridine-5-carboxymethylaminomethyl(34) synthesis GTPase MnmE [Clostridia bacterium]